MKALESKRTARLLMPSMTDVIIVVIFLMALAPLSMFDTWWHLKTGEYIVSTGFLPTHDIYSFTAATNPWTLHEWLSEVIFFLSFANFGLDSLIILTAIVVSIAIAFVFKSMLFERANLFLVLLLIVIVGSSVNLMWNPRPHIFSLLFISVFVFILRRFKRGEASHLWILPLLMIPWVNLHGGFIIGLVLIFILLFGESLKHLIGLKNQALNRKRLNYLGKIFLITLLAALINPYTYQILFYPFQYLGENIHTQFIVEWGATNFRNLVIFELLILLLFASLILSKKRKDLTDLICIFVFLHLSLTTIRYIPFFAIIIAPILAYHLNDAIFRIYQKLISRQSKFFGKEKIVILKSYLASRSGWVSKLDSVFNKHVILVLVTILVSVMSLSGQGPFQLGITESKYPINATEFLKENHIEGNMFNEYAWGGYLIWHLHPEYNVFIDGRADVYGERLLLEYNQIVNLQQNWTGILGKYDINFVVYKSKSLLVRLLREYGWVEVFRDETASILVRDNEINLPLIEKYGNLDKISQDKGFYRSTL